MLGMGSPLLLVVRFSITKCVKCDGVPYVGRVAVLFYRAVARKGRAGLEGAYLRLARVPPEPLPVRTKVALADGWHATLVRHFYIYTKIKGVASFHIYVYIHTYITLMSELNSVYIIEPSIQILMAYNTV